MGFHPGAAKEQKGQVIMKGHGLSLESRDTSLAGEF